MAKRKARGGTKKAVRAVKKARTPRQPAKRMSKKTSRKPARRGSKKPSKSAKRPKVVSRATTRKSATRKPSPRRRSSESAALPAGKTPRLNRPRRTLDDTVPTPPSSLNMVRQGSAARTGRAEILENQQVHGAMTRGITGGDVDVNLEQAYFSGDETPGGDNPTPDQDVVEDIGRAIGIEYQDNEELRASDKVADRDKHRWELDPASAEDYKERK